MKAMCKINRQKQNVHRYIGHLKGKGRRAILKPPPSYQPEEPPLNIGASGIARENRRPMLKEASQHTVFLHCLKEFDNNLGAWSD